MRVTKRTWVLTAAMLALLASWVLFHVQIQRSLATRLLLNSDNPNDEFFADTVKKTDDPVLFLERCWATGRIRHRELVAGFLKDGAVAHLPWLSRAEPLLLACATDADASVRELGLAALEADHSAHLFEAAQAQVDDVDPLVRLVGVNYVRKCDPQQAVPVLIHLLDDPDLRVVVAAEGGLTRVSGEDYGVRARLAISQPETPQVDLVNVEAIRRGVEKRKEWWKNHQKDYASTIGLQVTHNRITDLTRPAVPDFSLNDLKGQAVRLSNFRGKIVLLNFWATWCTACLSEIPDLVTLQKELSTQVVIIGVALDGVPDEDGESSEEHSDETSHNARPSIDAIRTKVERAVRRHQINYPVLLDPKNSVGGQYNGGELPTTVIIDAEGRMRRRFVGERSVAVFKAMLAEAGRPPAAIH